MAQDLSDSHKGGSESRGGSQVTKASPSNRSSGKSTPFTGGTQLFPGRIVTPTGRGGRLQDGATSRVSGNRMKNRTWGGRR